MIDYQTRAFIDSISHNWERFHWVEKNKAALRCPLCGDSKKDSRKIRGGLFINIKTKKWHYKCLNCGASHSFSKFLKEHNQILYRQYLPILFSHKKASSESQENDLNNKPVSVPKIDISSLNRILDLPKSHPGRTYLASRKVTRSFAMSSYYTDDFYGFAAPYNEKIAEKTKNSDRIPKEAIVFLIRDYHSLDRIVGFQARYLTGDLRYQTVMVDKTVPKTFVNTKTFHNDGEVNVIEGVFDSDFLPNSVAVLDSSLYQRAEAIGLDKDRTTLWYDNEPDNKDIMNLKKKAVERGWRVGFYDSAFTKKDLNQFAIDHGRDRLDTVMKKAERLSGMRAKLKMSF